MNGIFITGEKVFLRTITERDLTAAYRDWLNDEDVNRYNSHHRFPNYDEDMREYYETVIKSRENIVLAICDAATKEHIGNIALENINFINRSAELAILIGEKSHWGKGAGKEACALLIRHAFDTLNLHRVYCATSSENAGMQALARALGFTEEGRSREAQFKNGGFNDFIHFGLLKQEWTQ
jgi:ribosomal-protein-alanine N-acetyltransferase